MFEKDDRHCIDNYRPISILSTVFAIFEKAFAEKTTILIFFANSAWFS